MTEDDYAARLPRSAPAGTQFVTSYAEGIEVLRSNVFRPQPRTVTEAVELNDGVTFNLSGAVHKTRRRALGALVRPENIDQLRTNVWIPALRRAVRTRQDLCVLAREVFIQVAVALVGLDQVTTGEGREALLKLLAPMIEFEFAQFGTVEDQSQRRRAGLAAMDRYRDEFFTPSSGGACPVTESAGPGSSASFTSLMALFREGQDPAWSVGELAVRESIALLIGATASSTSGLVHVFDDWCRWSEDHPEDEEFLEDDTFATSFVMESLRMNPSKSAFVKIASESVTLTTGRHVPRGGGVAVMTWPVNTDEIVFGKDATDFNPRRAVEKGVQPYGLTLGTGAHQCLGLRILLGAASPGLLVDTLRAIVRAGISRDTEHPALVTAGLRSDFISYPVIRRDSQAAGD